MLKIVHEMYVTDRQSILEKKFLEELKRGDYDFNQPLVKPDLYQMSPLTAMVGLSRPEKQAVTVTVQGKIPAADISHTFPAGQQVFPVYGLYPDTLNTVVLQKEDGTKKILHIQTGPLPEEINPRAEIVTGQDRFNGCVLLLTIAQDHKPFAYDCLGDCRWYLSGNFNFAAKRLQNGHLLLGSCRTKYMYYSTGVMEVNAAGKVFHEYTIPGYYHHDQVELPDGNLLIGSEDPDFKTIEDTFVEVDRNTGAVVREWDLKDYLPPYPTASSGTADPVDWAHLNSLWYDAKTSSITVSVRHLDAIVNFAYPDGGIRWILGDPECWPEEYVKKYFFKPVGKDFHWQYEQHGAVVCGDGDIMCFDNHQWGAKRKENYLPPEKSWSRGVKFHLDLKHRTVQQVFQFGKERGGAFYSPYISNTEWLGPEHYLIHSGGICHVDGKTLRGLGSRLRRTYGKDRTELVSDTVEIQDGKVVLEMRTPINTYRALKLPLYAEGEVFEPGAGSLLGSLGETPADSVPGDLQMADTGKNIEDAVPAQLTEEKDRYKITVDLPVKMSAWLVLKDPETGKEKFYHIRTLPNFGSTVTHAPFNAYINKAGLVKPQILEILLENRLYHTGLALGRGGIQQAAG